MNSRLLYVDIEWNQIGIHSDSENEILEVGAISSIDEYIVDCFFK